MHPLVTKVLLSWAAAAVQQWAESRQEEAAAQHEQLACKKRAIRAWASLLSSCSTDDGDGHHFLPGCAADEARNYCCCSQLESRYALL